ncbi:hypothetical protein B0H11DRAFT_1934555 [Mycena galericulata]|nr:hypothetical protein B0H11DRAFT_1934555 [Mycena galericulata]
MYRIILLFAIPREDQRTHTAAEVDVTPSITVQTTIMQKPVMNKEGNSLKLESKLKRERQPEEHGGEEEGGDCVHLQGEVKTAGDGDGDGDGGGDGEHGPSARVAAGRAGGGKRKEAALIGSGRIGRWRRGPTHHVFGCQESNPVDQPQQYRVQIRIAFHTPQPDDTLVSSCIPAMEIAALSTQPRPGIIQLFSPIESVSIHTSEDVA